MRQQLTASVRGFQPFAASRVTPAVRARPSSQQAYHGSRPEPGTFGVYQNHTEVGHDVERFQHSRWSATKTAPPVQKFVPPPPPAQKFVPQAQHAETRSVRGYTASGVTAQHVFSSVNSRHEADDESKRGHTSMRR